MPSRASYNATEPEQLRGPEHAAAWCDALCKCQYAQETWDQLAFGLRAGAHPQIYITTTPRPTRLLKAIMADPRTVVTRGSTFDNRSNLASSFLEALERKYAGTRLGRREIEAEILEDVQGALWSRPTIDALRVKVAHLPPLRRIVIGIDPHRTRGEGAGRGNVSLESAGSEEH